MPLQYKFSCNFCGYARELLQGSYSMPFDSTGKMWSYKIFICNECGRPDSRYVPSVGNFNCRCHTCGNTMKAVQYVNDLKNLLCPECTIGSLEIRGKIQRYVAAELQASA